MPKRNTGVVLVAFEPDGDGAVNQTTKPPTPTSALTPASAAPAAFVSFLLEPANTPSPMSVDKPPAPMITTPIVRCALPRVGSVDCESAASRFVASVSASDEEGRLGVVRPVVLHWSKMHASPALHSESALHELPSVAGGWGGGRSVRGPVGAGVPETDAGDALHLF